MDNSICPNCGSIAEKPYSRKRQCKDCGIFVYFSKRFPYIYHRSVLTLNEIKLLDFYGTITALLNIENDKSIYKTAREALAKKWNMQPKPFDIVWFIANSSDRLIRFEPAELGTTKYRMGKLFDVASAIDLARARFIPYHDNKHSPKGYLQNSLRHSLQRIKLDKVSYVVIYANRCCKSCMVNDGVKLTIEEADKAEIIPFNGCENKLTGTKYTICTCEYVEKGMYSELKEYLY